MSGNHHPKNRLLMMRRIPLFSNRNKNKVNMNKDKTHTKDRPLRANTFRVKYYAMQSRLPTKRAFVYAPMDEEEEENTTIKNSMDTTTPLESMMDASI
jgi:hypothetical protein